MKYRNPDVTKCNIVIVALILFTAIFLAWGLTAEAKKPPPVGWSGKVVAVSDGDTLKVRRGKEVITIRLAEVDTPEKRQAWGPQATKFTASRCLRKIVEVRPETIDRYGRYVAEIILPGGANLGELLVVNGHAWHYAAYSKSTYLHALEIEARMAGRGLWAQPLPPWEWRKMQRRPKIKKWLGGKASK